LIHSRKQIKAILSLQSAKHFATRLANTELKPTCSHKEAQHTVFSKPFKKTIGILNLLKEAFTV